MTTTYVYDETNHLMEARPSTGGTVEYWYGLFFDDVVAKRETDSAVYYYTKDHLGSVREVVTSSGDVILRRGGYDLWGHALSGELISWFAFAGRDWDAESTVYYNRAAVL